MKKKSENEWQKDIFFRILPCVIDPAGWDTRVRTQKYRKKRGKWGRARARKENRSTRSEDAAAEKEENEQKQKLKLNEKLDVL